MSNDLSELKQKSIDCCSSWRINGAPRTGPIFRCMKSCTLKYKRAVRLAKKQYDSQVDDDLYDHLLTRDSDTFWRIWRNQNKDSNPLVTRVNGEVSQTGIAEAFRDHFRKVYSNNDTPAHESLRNDFSKKYEYFFRENVTNSIAPFFISWSEMLNVLAELKTGKSSAGSIRPEHVLHGSVKLAFHLHLLFNAMIQHGVVVSDFLKGTITPIVEDTQGDISDCNNYCGITLGGLFSKLFELAIDKKISPYLSSDWLQFGFKKRTSTSHALFVLRNTIDHFTSRGSDVFVSYLDCSKAFDRISHYGLFCKLMERGIPLCFLLIIIFWHINMSCRVKWGDALSSEFRVPLGTKQGGISSPGFFSLYIDDMVKILRRHGVGCHLIRTFVAYSLCR